MRTSLILGVTLLLALSTSIVQTHKSECSCSRLGPGINPCKCGEVVVKAARVEKPLYHASPEAINEAVATREVAERLSMGTVPGGIGSFPGSSSSGCTGGSISHGSSGSSSSSSSSSSLSSVGLLGRLISGGGGHHHHGLSSGVGCGCGRKGAPLGLHDLLSHKTQGKVVPSFRPIGDLCYPSRQSRFDLVRTKVTPAYPAKFRCCPPPSQRLCVNMMNGQIDQTDIESLGSTGSQTGLLGGHAMIDGLISGGASEGLGASSNLGGYTSSNAGSAYGFSGYSGLAGSSATGLSSLSSGMSSQYGSGSSFGGSYGPSGSLGGSYGSGSSFGGSYGPSGSLGGSYGSSGSFGGSHGSSGSFGGSHGSSGGFGESYSSSGSFGGSAGSYAGSYAGSSMQSLGQLSSGISNLGGMSNSLYGASQGNVEAVQESAMSAGSSCNDFGDDVEMPAIDPRLPADPVSLTLAYRNYLPYVMVYNRKGFVPEDKLAFGHRTVPMEWVPPKRGLDVAEEKLQIPDRPVVELKPVTSRPVTVGVYDEQEEAKLAELEVIERERINEEAMAEQPQTQFITYGDLGYAPVMFPGSSPRSGNTQMDFLNTEDVVEEGCGPVGPPVPGYIPGGITVNRETIETEGEIEGDAQREHERTFIQHYGLDDETSEEDEIGVTSGIFSRLRNAARRYPTPCLQNSL